MSFFTDALGDSMISGGTIKVTVNRVYYNSGVAESVVEPKTFIAKKSIQPLEPASAHARGFPDYATNQFITIYSTKKIPLPSKKGEVVTVKFNGQTWYVRKVQPWIWDEGTALQMGYYEITLSRYAEEDINPD